MLRALGMIFAAFEPLRFELLDEFDLAAESFVPGGDKSRVSKVS
ncbi:MAG: hypothetical protein ACLQAT_12160 [Candidatus Binataceae bacterium]